ncbi:MAG: hypothetical protein QGH45_14710, partial [Myxococcota bacterium]|nr:hypothetical protein [Myxococcota bacterium]
MPRLLPAVALVALLLIACDDDGDDDATTGDDDVGDDDGGDDDDLTGDDDTTSVPLQGISLADADTKFVTDENPWSQIGDAIAGAGDVDGDGRQPCSLPSTAIRRTTTPEVRSTKCWALNFSRVPL